MLALVMTRLFNGRFTWARVATLLVVMGMKRTMEMIMGALNKKRSIDRNRHGRIHFLARSLYLLRLLHLLEGMNIDAFIIESSLM